MSTISLPAICFTFGAFTGDVKAQTAVVTGTASLYVIYNDSGALFPTKGGVDESRFRTKLRLPTHRRLLHPS